MKIEDLIIGNWYKNEKMKSWFKFVKLNTSYNYPMIEFQILNTNGSITTSSYLFKTKIDKVKIADMLEVENLVIIKEFLPDTHPDKNFEAEIVTL